MTIWEATVHQFYDCLRLVGMRDRLRCPKCKKVGTWKPHGGFLDFEDIRKVRRWMCKWCGYYIGPEHTHWAKPCFYGYWDLPAVAERGSFMDTPKRVTEKRYWPCAVDPWRG